MTSARSVTVTGRSRSRHTEAISEPTNPEPMISTRRGLACKAADNPVASSTVRTVKTPPVHLLRGWARAGPGSGGDQQPVVGHLFAVAELHQVVVPVQADGCHPSFQFASTRRSRGSLVVGGHHP